VASDKSRGKIGTAELDLTQFHKDTFNELTLNLKDCKYEGATITVGLKGVISSSKEQNDTEWCL
jgi:hypothetical protein